MGITCARPPPVAPPFRPNTGPSAGSRRQMIAFLPMAFSASPRPIVVVVFPSPAGVGRYGGHQDQLAARTLGQAIEIVQRNLRFVFAETLEGFAGNT